MNQENKWFRFLKEPRIILTLLILLFSLIAIGPSASPGESGTMELHTNILKGLDLQGGVRAIVLPEESTKAIIDESITVLNTRLSAFGLQETKIRPLEIDNKWYIEVELAGSTEEQLRMLLERQGKFEAYIPRNIDLTDNKGTYKLDGKAYDITVSNNTVIINNTEQQINKMFTLDNIDFIITNITSDFVTLSGRIYQGKDILQVFKDAQHSNVRQISADNYRFQFEIVTTTESAERFAKITKDANIISKSINDAYLDAEIELYLDDNMTDSLKIASSLRGQKLTTPQITGSGNSQTDAVEQMKTLQSILESGALPSKIQIVQINEISPTLGKEFMNMALLTIFVAILAVSVILFLRYKNPNLVIPMILTSVSEIVIILGFAALVKWTIDLPSIAGIVAAIGSGIDDQIIITDEADKQKEEMNITKKLKRAFFIIMASATTTIAAMIPLLTVAAGGVKGFAFTTIIGVISGVLITRPAFSKVLEYLNK
ncbi:hypothetical protein GQ473_06970 [archaeon]|nr:hypothetical protein [archaeon]